VGNITNMKANRIKENSLTLSELKRQLNYDPLTGIFTWIIPKKNNAIKSGTIAGCRKKGEDYIIICINKLRFQANRLAWFYMKGIWPTYEVDHMNTHRDDNTFSNLRDTPYNGQNKQKAYKNNKSGSRYPGVSYHSRDKTYNVRVTVNGERIPCGTFKTLIEAENETLRVRRLYYPGNLL